jgi:hypothetical protein
VCENRSFLTQREKVMRALSFGVVCSVILAGFALDLWALHTIRAAEIPRDPTAQESLHGPPVVGTNSVLDKLSEEHLFKMQESVLKAVEESNAKTKEEFDFAILAVGFVGTMVLAVFGYFGLSTAIDSKALEQEAQKLIKDLKALKEEVEHTRQSISDEALAMMSPKLAEIANYGMNMASFANESWTSMSFEDQKQSCEEAIAAIDGAGLGDKLDAARSFVLARYGSALILNGATLAAAEKFKESCRLNKLNRPDRPYNLACAYARLAAVATIAAEKSRYESLALDELANCFALATDEPIGNTGSKAYFRGASAKDPDLNAIRTNARFSLITA